MNHLVRTASLFIALAFGVAGHASAQLKLGSKAKYTMYLQYEPIEIVTTVRNELANPLVFNLSERDPRFYYEVRNDSGVSMPLVEGEKPPFPEMVRAQSAETMTNNITRYYVIRSPGYYTIQPCVEWMGKIYRGENQHIEVTRGREVTRTECVVPQDGTTRSYMLLHISRNQEDHLLLRIDDENNSLCYGVFPLGRTIINQPPQLAVDAKANVHVLFHASPRTYRHVAFSPNGFQFEDKVIGRDFINVKLITKPDGTVESTGKPAPKDDRAIPVMKSTIEQNQSGR